MNHDGDEADRLVGLAGMGKRPFTSAIPLIGSLISKARTAWLRIADQSYLDDQREQQVAFNQALINAFTEQDEWLIQQDRHTIDTQRDFATTLTQTVQIKQQIEILDAQLRALEQELL